MFHVPIHSFFFLLLGTEKHYLTAEHQDVSYVARHQAKHIHVCQFEVLITLCLFHSHDLHFIFDIQSFSCEQ